MLSYILRYYYNITIVGILYKQGTKKFLVQLKLVELFDKLVLQFSVY